MERERGTAALGNRRAKKQRPREPFRMVLSDPGGFQQINIRKVIAKILPVVGTYSSGNKLIFGAGTRVSVQPSK